MLFVDSVRGTTPKVVMESVKSLICTLTSFAEIDSLGEFLLIIGAAVCHWSTDMIIEGGLFGLARRMVV